MFYIYHDRQASRGKDKASIVTFGIPFMNHYLKSTDMTARSFLNVPGENITATLSKVKKKKEEAAEMTAQLTNITGGRRESLNAPVSCTCHHDRFLNLFF